ncbi:hypothetical protein [Desertimonas flava]|uniref:hypothetical protein n=1 Tax=Desertimonas flava TaxID=2064846 RepID=UPI000E34FBB3|nr:hypothetical protein [Desertimonas flava]
MKAPHLSPVPDRPVPPALTSLWFDGSPVEPGLQLLPPSQRFDPRRASVRFLLRRMALGTDRLVHFDAGWDPIARELVTNLAAIDPAFAITTAAALWAELRVVTSIDDEPGVRRLLREAAGESMTRCERCGEPGRPVRCMPRQRTLCPGHAAEHRFDEAVRVTVEKLRAAEQRSA